LYSVLPNFAYEFQTRVAQQILSTILKIDNIQKILKCADLIQINTLLPDYGTNISNPNLPIRVALACLKKALESSN
jgi:hypothetical protein